ncbi:hypothetical protein BDQ17DRAFT_1421800 [Cyathus striatus]|nr:hypothetical protein BDQ17DRAFT_1421800 [Cyathus striatus]
MVHAEVGEAALNLLEVAAPICGAVPLVGSILESSLEAALVVIRKVQEVKTKKEQCQALANHALGVTTAIATQLMNAEPDTLERQKIYVQGLLSTIESIRKLFEKLAHASFFALLNGRKSKIEIEKLQRQLETALVSFSIKSSMRIEGTITSLEKMVKSGQKRESSVFLKDHLHPVANAGFLSRNDRAGCLPNTRTALLAEIDKWLNDNRPNVPRVYWLSGLGGTGKSTIAHSVCESLHKDQKLGASFFFSREEADRRRPELILPTISYQLALFNNLYHRQVSITIEEKPDIPEHAQRYQFEELIKNPIQKLSGRLPPLVIVLDAVDECNKFGDDVLPLLLQGISQIPGNIKVFITSRPENAIQDMFRSAGPGTEVYHPYALHNMEETIAQEDIKLYLVHHLQRIQQEHSVKPPWPADVDLQTLVTRAGVFFTFASTIINFIADRLYSPDDQLRRFLQQDPTFSRSTFAQVDNLYMYILKNFIQERDDAGVARDRPDADILCERFRVVVGAIVSLQDPLPISALACIVQRGEGDTRAALHPLRSVLDIPGSSDSLAPVRIFHPSFSEFLTTSQRCQDRRFLIQEPPTHARLALRCFEVMQDQLSRNMCKIESKYVMNDEIPQLEERLKKYVSPELSYACRYWSIHLSKAGTVSSYELFQSLSQFCFKKLLYWIEVLSLQGKFSRCIENIVGAQTWCKANSIEGEVIDILRDAYRLDMDFHKVLRESAVQVYHSALVFMPECSFLNHYSHELSSSVAMITPRSDDWEACLLVFEGHAAGVGTAKFFPDGSRVVSGSEDCTVRIWDSVDGTAIACLEGHTLAVTSIDISSDSTYMVTGSKDTTICLWITSTFAEIYVLDSHQAAINSVVFSADGLYMASGSDDMTVRIWNVASGLHVRVLEGHTSSLQSISYSEDGSFLVTGSLDGVVKIWNPETGQCLKTLDVHKEAVLSVCVAPDNRRVAVGSADNTIRVWDATTGSLSMELKGHSSAVNAVDFSRNAARIVSGSRDGMVIVWNAFTGKQVTVFRGHAGFVSCTKFSPSGANVLSASADRTVRLWDAALTAVRGSSNWVTILAISNDATHVASGSTDGKIALWETSDGHMIYEIAPYQTGIISLAISPSDNSIASVAENSSVIDIWNLLDGSNKGKLQGHTAPIFCCSHSWDGKQISSTSEDYTIRIWDAASLTCLTVLKTQNHGICCVPSPSGDQLVVGSLDCSITVWDLRNRKQIAKFTEYDSPVLWVTYSPDAKWLIAWYEDEAVRVYDTYKLALSQHKEWRFDRLASTRSTLTADVQAISYDQLLREDEKIYIQEDGWITIPENERRICWVPPSRRPPWMRSLWQRRKHILVIGSQTSQITMIGLRDGCWTKPSDASLH